MRYVAEWRLRRSERQGRALIPFRPAVRDDVPAASWAPLESVCGPLTLDQLLVKPGTWRTRGRNGIWAERAWVLAFGEKAVAHWVELEDGSGSVESMPVEEILAIDDRIVLLHGRLSLIGRNRRMTVDYNAVAEPALRVNLAGLRRVIAGPAFPVRPSFVWIGARGKERPERELPYKWACLLAHSPELRLDERGDEMVAAGNVVEMGRSRGPATGIAVLGPQELVVASEPDDSLLDSRYGVDLVVVPRFNLRDVGWEEGNLLIRLCAPDGSNESGEGPSISRPLDERLFAAMRRSFGDEIRWA